MKKTRKHLTGAEKVAILRRHLIDKQAVSDLCDEAGIQPSQFYRWLKQFFENGVKALERVGGNDAGRQVEIFNEKREKLEHARNARRDSRQIIQPQPLSSGLAN